MPVTELMSLTSNPAFSIYSVMRAGTQHTASSLPAGSAMKGIKGDCKAGGGRRDLLLPACFLLLHSPTQRHQNQPDCTSSLRVGSRPTRPLIWSQKHQPQLSCTHPQRSVFPLHGIAPLNSCLHNSNFLLLFSHPFCNTSMFYFDLFSFLVNNFIPG